MSHWGAITAHLSTQQVTEGFRDEVLMLQTQHFGLGRKYFQAEAPTDETRWKSWKTQRLNLGSVQWLSTQNSQLNWTLYVKRTQAWTRMVCCVKGQVAHKAPRSLCIKKGKKAGKEKENIHFLLFRFIFFLKGFLDWIWTFKLLLPCEISHKFWAKHQYCLDQ